jgi:hypothetical protein
VALEKFIWIKVAVVIVLNHIFPPADTHLKSRYCELGNVLLMDIKEKIATPSCLWDWSAG